MTEENARFLLTVSGCDLLRRIVSAAAILRLRKGGADAEHVSAAFEVAKARHRAVGKFGSLASSLYFTAEALEQASSRGAAEYHARRMVDAGLRHVLDLCGGIGADAVAFARAGLRVTLVEIDPVRALFAQENMRAAGLDALVHVRCADATTLLASIIADALEEVSPALLGVWFDPGRRAGGRRLHAPDDYLPPLSLLGSLQALGVENVGVKLSPAVDHADALAWGLELEFLSDKGECKEGLLWSGALRRGAHLSATVLRDGASFTVTDSFPEGLAINADPPPSPPRSGKGCLRCEGGSVDIVDDMDHMDRVDSSPAGLNSFPSRFGRGGEEPAGVGSEDSQTPLNPPASGGKQAAEPLSANPSPLQGKAGRGEQESKAEGPADFDPFGKQAVAGFLYEPDPAVIRAHLVLNVGAMVGASMIDPQVAYLIGPTYVRTPFADAYRIVDRFPFHLHKLQRALNERSVGRVIIKKRAFPQEPEQIRKQLKLTGDREIVVVLTRVGLQHQAILCEREQR